MLVKLLTKVLAAVTIVPCAACAKWLSRSTAWNRTWKKLSDDELKAKTNEFRARPRKASRWKALIPEAFAVVREASKRVFGMRHFDAAAGRHGAERPLYRRNAYR